MAMKAVVPMEWPMYCRSDWPVTSSTLWGKKLLVGSESDRREQAKVVAAVWGT